MTWQEYVDSINATCDKLTELKSKLDDSVFDGKDFENFNEQEQVLKVCFYGIFVFQCLI